LAGEEDPPAAQPAGEQQQALNAVQGDEPLLFAAVDENVVPRFPTGPGSRWAGW
jgi:type VI secretion system protein VasG